MSADLHIQELVDDEQIASAFAVMSVLRPHLRADLFVEQVRRMGLDGYCLAGGTVEGRVVVVAGYRVSETLFRGRHLFVDDLVTDPAHQKKGYGTAMLRYLAEFAREEKIERIYLDSRITAKSYYERLGFTMHTSIPCWIEGKRLLKSDP